jgi:dTDP-D-glucose 4,6-dehydratase
VDGTQPGSVHEARLLSLSIEKAGGLLGWLPAWEFQEAVRRTVQWYHRRHVSNTPDLLQFSQSQIADYTEAARSKRLAWAAA